MSLLKGALSDETLKIHGEGSSVNQLKFGERCERP